MASATKLVPRDIDKDPGSMLLYYELKYVEDGKPNFAEVAKSMGVATANFA
jgi:hypothetical protein